MATTPSPLVWDFNHIVDTPGIGGGVGGVINYLDEEAQTLYLKLGKIETRTATTKQGHWSSTMYGEEIDVTPIESYSKIAFDHPINGVVYGVAVRDGDLVFLRYIYGMDLSDILTSLNWSMKADNAIDQLSLNIQNVGYDIFNDSSTLFTPGARIPVKFRFENSEYINIGTAYADDISYGRTDEEVSISGRNAIGFFLKDQTFDEEYSMTGTTTELVTDILDRSGLKEYEVQFNVLEHSFEFKPEDTLLSAIETINDVFATSDSLKGYGIQELPDGTVIIGSERWRGDRIANSTHTFNNETELYSISVSKNLDEVYTHLRATGKVPTTDFSEEETYDVGDYVTYSVPEFSESEDYPTGSYVTHESKVYKANTDILAILDFDNEKDYTNGYHVKYTPSEFDEEKEYEIGDYVFHDNKLYRALYKIIQQPDFDSSLDYPAYYHVKHTPSEFEETSEYEIGTYVIHDNKIYKPISKYTPLADFERGKEYHTGDRVRKTIPIFNKFAVYSQGDYTVRDDILYRAPANIPAGEWNALLWTYKGPYTRVFTANKDILIPDVGYWDPREWDYYPNGLWVSSNWSFVRNTDTNYEFENTSSVTHAAELNAARWSCVNSSNVWNSSLWDLVDDGHLRSEDDKDYEFVSNKAVTAGEFKGADWDYLGIPIYWKPSQWDLQGEGNVFKCRSSVVTPGPFDGSKWTYRGTDDIEPVVLPITNFTYWSVGEHKTIHLSAPYTMTETQFNSWVNEQKLILQYVGVAYKYTGIFKPQLIVGDIAQIRENHTANLTRLGIVSEVTHTFSRSDGFKTEFSVDSGGESTDGDNDVKYSRVAKINGYNRKQTITDLIKKIFKMR